MTDKTPAVAHISDLNDKRLPIVPAPLPGPELSYEERMARYAELKANAEANIAWVREQRIASQARVEALAAPPIRDETFVEARSAEREAQS